MTHDPIEFGDITIRFLVDEAETGGAMTMFETAVAHRGRVPAPHSHDAFEETFYGLTGTLTVMLDGEEILLGPGEALYIRRNVVHGFEALDGDCSFLAVTTPGVLGSRFFLEMREVFTAAAGGPPDTAGIHAVMRRHGLTPA